MPKITDEHTRQQHHAAESLLDDTAGRVVS